MTSGITQLRVGDENFLVTSLIERCPKSMMLRELVRNAIEGAQTGPADASESGRRVEISGIEIEGGIKLAIWNTGRGMDADELFRMCDIASSIRKENNLDQNFGMGAKVASLPSNRHGMRYRSCHEGRVCEVMIGQRGGVYGRLRRMEAGSDDLHDVLDVTDAAIEEGRSLDQDWTEVVLLGNRPGQDTLTDPYDGAPRMQAAWIAEELHKRFFRLPEDVHLILRGGPAASEEMHLFRPVAERAASHWSDGSFRSDADRNHRRELVACADGIMIHYVFDAFDDGGSGSLGKAAAFLRHGFAGLIYKDEIYDIAWQHEWLQAGPVYGIPFCGRDISVFVEFPTGYPVVPDGYRQFVRLRDGMQEQVHLRRYASMVYVNRPTWLIELIQKNASGLMGSEEITLSLDRLLRELQVPRRPREWAMPAGSFQKAEHAEGVDSGQSVAPSALEVEAAPEIIMLRDFAGIEARGISGRGARYYPETHQLFVNCLYAPIEAMQAALELEFGWAQDQETVRYHARESAEQSFVARIGRMLVFALAKYGTWDGWEMDLALSTQALTLAADDYYQSLPSARVAMRAVIRLRQLAGPAASA